jgi:hypothetical protein
MFLLPSMWLVQLFVDLYENNADTAYKVAGYCYFVCLAGVLIAVRALQHEFTSEKASLLALTRVGTAGIYAIKLFPPIAYSMRWSIWIAPLLAILVGKGYMDERATLQYLVLLMSLNIAANLFAGLLSAITSSATIAGILFCVSAALLITAGKLVDYFVPSAIPGFQFDLMQILAAVPASELTTREFLYAVVSLATIAAVSLLALFLIVPRRIHTAPREFTGRGRSRRRGKILFPKYALLSRAMRQKFVLVRIVLVPCFSATCFTLAWFVFSGSGLYYTPLIAILIIVMMDCHYDCQLASESGAHTLVTLTPWKRLEYPITVLAVEWRRVAALIPSLILFFMFEYAPYATQTLNPRGIAPAMSLAPLSFLPWALADAICFSLLTVLLVILVNYSGMIRIGFLLAFSYVVYLLVVSGVIMPFVAIFGGDKSYLYFSAETDLPQLIRIRVSVALVLSVISLVFILMIRPNDFGKQEGPGEVGSYP